MIVTIPIRERTHPQKYGQLVETCNDGSSIMEIHIVEKEQWWIGVILSQGKEVEIIEPEHIKERI